MNRLVAAITVAGVVVIAGILAILLATRENRVELNGRFLKVRSHQVDPERTLALLDLRIENPSTQQFKIREIEVLVDEAGGTPLTAEVFAETDVQRFLDFYPTLGAKDNRGLLRSDTIDSKQTTDRTLFVSVPMSDARLQKRKGLRLIIRDVDGPEVEIREQR